ncbi:unnamed protein product [Schistosoma rodhaini]|uniref:Uncharacterized protein n=1 Tax=Schistosoma rodhaini TaxID=6188 RepID=A0AA85GC27_9TREM|nr:unnamed protein product [Schistosoma rodhaini]
MLRKAHFGRCGFASTQFISNQSNPILVLFHFFKIAESVFTSNEEIYATYKYALHEVYCKLKVIVPFSRRKVKYGNYSVKSIHNLENYVQYRSW